MSAHSRRAGRPPRHARVLAAAACVTLLIAACGGGRPGQAGATAAAGTVYQQALAYAQCMRAHGEPGWPDPTSQGNFLLHGQPGITMGSLYASANRACGHLLPDAGQVTAAQQRQITAQALRYASCMRSHGLPAFPDPVVQNGGVAFQSGPGSGVGPPGSPQFQSANRLCQRLDPLPGPGGRS